MRTPDIQQDYQRLAFDRAIELLSEKDYECRTIPGQEDGTDLIVKVKGPGDAFARFSLRVNTILPGQPVSVSAYYTSDLLGEVLTESWTLAPADLEENLVNDLIEPFLGEASYSEFSRITKAEIINDDNLEDFIDLLTDETLTEENVYAVGFRIEDEGGMEIAAAAGFFLTEEEVYVDSIVISDNYEMPGFEEYIAQYIFNTVEASEE